MLRLLLVFWLFLIRTFANVIDFLFAEKALNVGNVIFFFFDNDIETYYREVLAMTLFLLIITLKTFLVVLVFFMVLVGRKLLFPTRYVSKGGVNRFIVPKVLIFILSWLIALEVLTINFLHIG